MSLPIEKVVVDVNSNTNRLLSGCATCQSETDYVSRGIFVKYKSNIRTPLTEANKSHVHATNADLFSFEDMMNVVHVDEKWFFGTKVKNGFNCGEYGGKKKRSVPVEWTASSSSLIQIRQNTLQNSAVEDLAVEEKTASADTRRPRENGSSTIARVFLFDHAYFLMESRPSLDVSSTKIS
ncbi:hypothetical protein H257_12813 [Aphanomyces astaci]|uniref:Uncharacterized protein n=1 Tax=Aphanomyces astaci TaxID=112090 RepID=W4FYG1_APHAT|nr:hypothetical protein H257_12813 [Aphanomyces astaci]ETV72006.1 hypothetical protein H257_12813 [Aphanomyces astaci]|eukprot:XP_009838449.1 hypothetical protein H257_12813 [Aphanomyces astaci]